MFPSAPPPNHHVQFALKSSVRFTPPSTPPKSPSPIYPRITKSDLPSNCLYDLPPPKLPSLIYPQIVCMIYPPQIAKSDLPSNRQVRFTLKSSVRFTPPRNRQVRFTLKSPSLINPSNRLYNKSDLLKLGGVNRTDDLRVSQT